MKAKVAVTKMTIKWRLQVTSFKFDTSLLNLSNSIQFWLFRVIQ